MSDDAAAKEMAPVVQPPMSPTLSGVPARFGVSRIVSGTAARPQTCRGLSRGSSPSAEDGQRAPQDSEDGPQTALEASKMTQEASKRLPQWASRGKSKSLSIRWYSYLGFELFGSHRSKTARTAPILVQDRPRPARRPTMAS